MSPRVRRLCFDGQVFQTPAWHRGMGKYSMELIVALNDLNKEARSWETIDVVLSDSLTTEPSVIENFSKRAPEVNIVKLSLERNEYDNRPVADRNRKVIDKYLSSITSNEEAIDYIVLSLMQSETAPAFSALERVNNYLLFYDLIPLMFHKTYLRDSLHQKSYLSKLAELFKADKYLAISKTVANDLAVMLGIDKDKIISIDGAPIDHGHEAEPFDIPEPFILMPTGNDLRKNNRRGIEGFEIFNKKNGYKYSLVVTSVFQDFEVEELKKLSKKVIFTGNVSGERLEYLYQKTEALLFPTEYEGLGLPILEALEKEKPVACSDISVFREISDTAFEYFNPKDIDSISRALSKAVSNERLPLEEYKRVIDKFTWRRTANIFNEASVSHDKDLQQEKVDFTIFCPSTDESPYGIEIQQLHSELVKLGSPNYYMDTYGDKNKKSINYLVQCSRVSNIAKPTAISFSDNSLPIYFVEDSADAAAILLVALAKPGVLVLRSGDLAQLWSAAINRNMIHQSRLTAEREFEEDIEAEGLISSLVANQEVVIVHDGKLKNKIEAIVKKIPGALTRVVLLPEASSELVYAELDQDFSILDYEAGLRNGAQSFGDYAKLLLSEVRL